MFFLNDTLRNFYWMDDLRFTSFSTALQSYLDLLSTAFCFCKSYWLKPVKMIMKGVLQLGPYWKDFCFKRESNPHPKLSRTTNNPLLPERDTIKIDKDAFSWWNFKNVSIFFIVLLSFLSFVCEKKKNCTPIFTYNIFCVILYEKLAFRMWCLIINLINLKETKVRRQSIRV